MCPSDPWQPTILTPAAPGFMLAVPATGTWQQYFTSYAGVEGTFVSRMMAIPGSSYMNPTDERINCNGIIFGDGSVGIAQITDGTSNPFIYGEKAHTKVAFYPATAAKPTTQYHMWTSGFY